MNYEETAKLEQHVKVKNQADFIYKKFMNEARLSPSKFKDGRFKVWSDSHNAEYIKINDKGNFVYIGEYLNNKYEREITPESLFSGIKNECRSVGHIQHIKFGG